MSSGTLAAPTPCILAIETATDTCSVAVAQERRILAEYALRVPRSHAERLTPMIADILASARIDASELTGVAVSMGPGSFTGLRIGVSTAKGLAFALGIPLFGVSSLEAAARSVIACTQPGDAIAAVFNSRRHEVYLAVYAVESSEALRPLSQPRALELDAIADALSIENRGRLWVVGEGAPAAEAQLHAGRNAVFLPEAGPEAAHVAHMGLEAMAAGREVNLATFEPFYLKDFVPREKKHSIYDRLPSAGESS